MQLVKVFTTEELILILEGQRTQVMNGIKLIGELERDQSSAIPEQEIKGFYGFLAEMKSQGIDKAWDTRERIWEYQKLHNISGIAYKTVNIGGNGYTLPFAHDQLIMVDGDAKILKNAIPTTREAFEQYIKVNPLAYIYLEYYDKWGATHDIQTTSEAIFRQIDYYSEWCDLGWVELHFYGEHEGSISIGWGNPIDAIYKKHDKEDGSERINYHFQTASTWVKRRQPIN